MEASKFFRLFKSGWAVVCISGIIIVSGNLSCSKDNYVTTPDKAQKMVEEMLSGRETKTPIKPLTQTYGSFSLEEAYQIQSSLAKRLSETLGEVTGYKVAFASKASQRQFGIDQPASGPFFRRQRIPNDSMLKSSDFMGLIIETEVAFTIGKKIDHPLENVAELKPYIKWVHASFDIGNDGFNSRQVKPGASDMVASGMAYCFVLGPAMDPSLIDVDKIILKLAVNGNIVTEAASVDVMGSPWNSLLWLSNQIVHRGNALEPGDVVLTGTAAPAYKAKGSEAAGVYEGDCGALGKVTCTIR